MHYAILNSSGNALGWFTDEAEARGALAAMVGDSDADLDLVAFAGPGRPVEPISTGARSAWPSVRLVWSTQKQPDAGNINWKTVTFRSADNILPDGDNGTDDRVPSRTPRRRSSIPA